MKDQIFPEPTVGAFIFNQAYDLEFINFQQFIYDPSFWKPKHFIFFDYACRTDSVDVQLNDEAEAYIWVSLDAAVDLPLDAYTRTSINRLIEMRKS